VKNERIRQNWMLFGDVKSSPDDLRAGFQQEIGR
jgi:hypothetical protein